MVRIAGLNYLRKKVTLAVIIGSATWIALFTVVLLAEDLELAFLGFASIDADAVRPLHVVVVKLTAIDVVDGEIFCGTALNTFAAKLFNEFDVGTPCPVSLTFAHLAVRTNSDGDCRSSGSGAADFLFKLEDFLADDFAALR